MWFIDKTSISLDHESINLESDWNAQWTYNFSLIINKKGDNLKLAFLLFKSKTDNYIKNQDYSNIAKTKINNAYRDVYLWIKVN